MVVHQLTLSSVVSSDSPTNYKAPGDVTTPQNGRTVNLDKYKNLLIHYSVENISSQAEKVEAVLFFPNYAPVFSYDSSRANQISFNSEQTDPKFTDGYSYVGGSYTATPISDQTPIAIYMGGPIDPADGAPSAQSLSPTKKLTMVAPVKPNSHFDFNNPIDDSFYNDTYVFGFVSDDTDTQLGDQDLYAKPFKNIVLANEESLPATNYDNYNDLVKAAVANVTALFNDDATKDTTTDPASIVKVTPGTTAGSWNIDYNYSGVSKHITGIKTTDASYIDGKDFKVNYGSNWDSQKFNGLTKHLDQNGQAVTKLSDGVNVTIQLNGKTVNAVDTNNAGAVYDVTYTTGNNAASKTVKVTVGQRGNIPSNNNSNNNNSTTNNNGNSGNSAWNPSNPSNPNGTGLPNYAAVKGSAVYATKGIYMYRSANFKKSQRMATYPKAKRVNRPMFVVLGYDKSNGGALRYKVRDVNHGKKTAGKVGYITANPKYVVNVYYKTMPKSHKITVINKKGIHAYKNVNLTGRAKTFKKGTHVTVKSFEKHNLTTRYKLSNGTYITANKKLVIQGNY